MQKKFLLEMKKVLATVSIDKIGICGKIKKVHFEQNLIFKDIDEEY